MRRELIACAETLDPILVPQALQLLQNLQQQHHLSVAEQIETLLDELTGSLQHHPLKERVLQETSRRPLFVGRAPLVWNTL